ncbi:glyoxalase [Leucobacter sp. CSA2]|uniref:Glyoxalase n=1 Tax=Leucobacter edaphi TaxID=2796472 RepID=A0A934UY87_9MICO|nr:VOC family protein [Leucobacter edaphi]MBK0422541.1 glyoxalase [Leucobacter edaphi]
MIFVNLTTTDLERSKAFYTALGCEINPLFTDENAACVVWDENTFFMILTHGHFAQFTDKPIVDPRTGAQVIVALTRDSREHVDATVTAGLAAGGGEHRDPQDYGFMYQRSLSDPDGNLLEFTYMEPQAAEEGPGAYVDEHGAGPDPVPGA